MYIHDMHCVYVENVTKHKHKHYDYYTPLYYGNSIAMTLTPYEDAKSLEDGPVVPTARITINQKRYDYTFSNETKLCTENGMLAFEGEYFTYFMDVQAVDDKGIHIYIYIYLHVYIYIYIYI